MNILRPILAILIIFIPLYPKFPLWGVADTYVAIRLDDLVVAIAVFIWLFYQIKHHFPILKEKITWLVLAYLAAILLSTLYAIFIFQVVSSHLLILNFLRRIEYISLMFITISAVQNKKDLNFTYISLIITVLLVSIYGFGQKYLHFPVISTMNSEFSKGQLLQMDVWTRISSTFAGHYDLAAYLTLVLIIIGSLFLISRSKSSKYISLITWLIGFSLLNLTASRISTFAFWGGMILALIFIKKYLWIIPFSILMIFSIINSKDLNRRLVATLNYLPQHFPSLPQQSPLTNTLTPTPVSSPTVTQSTPTTILSSKPVPTVFHHLPAIEEFPSIDTDAGVARSGEIRFNAEWPRAINAFKRNIFLGSGPGSITLATDNDYLRLLGESGLLGLITFLIIFLYFIYQTIKKPSHLAFIFLACLIATGANALFIDVWEASKFAYTFWIMMGIYYQVLKFNND